MKKRFVLLRAVSSVLAFGLIGCESDNGADSDLYEPICEKTAQSTCSNKADKNQCMDASALVLDALYANTGCMDTIEASLNCRAKQPIVCTERGNPTISDEACKTEDDAFRDCMGGHMELQKWSAWCDKVAAANCSENSDNGMCMVVGAMTAAVLIYSKECWPKWKSYVYCLSQSEPICNAENQAIAEKCEQKTTEVTACVDKIKAEDASSDRKSFPFLPPLIQISPEK